MQASLATLRRTLNRLVSVELSDIAQRVTQRRGRNDGRRLAEPRQFDLGDGPLPKLPGLDPADPLAKAELLSRWRSMAEAAKAGRYRFLGREWLGVTHAGKWHLDPATGQAWPQTLPGFDSPCRQERELGDIRYVWELNQLQFLQPIAALAGAEQDRELARYCAAEIESWIDANPPFQGVNWACRVELALRIVSFCTIAALIGDEAFTADQRRKLRGALAAHGHWLARNLSLTSSANDALIAEAGGLFLLGALAPDLADAATYEDYGRRTLVAEALKQIHDDGVGAGQSPSTTAFTVEWLLLCSLVAERVGKPLPPLLRDRLLRAGEHLRWITDEGGNQPRIGDDDRGCVLASQMEPEPHYVSSVLSGLAAMLDRPGLAPPTPSRPHLRHLIFGAAGPAATAPQGVRCFPTGGCTAIRETIAGRKVLIVFDHGPLDSAAMAARGHADALAILLHMDDQPVLIDAGADLPRSGGPWRDDLRATRAHNTLNIDGMDQSMSGPFDWSHRANHRLLHYRDAPGAWSIEADHDGYLKRYGVNHCRQIARAAGPSVTCTDWLLGTPQQPRIAVEIRYLIAPGLEVLCPDGFTAQIRRNGEALCEISLTQWTGDGNAALSLIVEDAVASPRFGEKVKTLALVCHAPASGLIGRGVTTRIEFDCAPPMGVGKTARGLG